MIGTSRQFLVVRRIPRRKERSSLGQKADCSRAREGQRRTEAGLLETVNHDCSAKQQRSSFFRLPPRAPSVEAHVPLSGIFPSELMVSFITRAQEGGRGTIQAISST